MLIENQLEGTDHRHLGQTLTYAAGLDAATVVWIAGEFTDEHRATLDWLNEITAEDVSFFGLEVELWRIGDSLPAPKFNIVCRPNEWTKQTPPRELTETQQLYLEYWGALRAYLQQCGSPVRPRKPLPQSWTDFSIGRSGFWLQATGNLQDKRVGVTLCLRGEHSKDHFRRLLEGKAAIEAAVGSGLDWQERPDRVISVIALEQADTDLGDRAKWTEQQEWLRGKLEAFNAAFRERVRALDASEYVEEDEEEPE